MIYHLQFGQKKEYEENSAKLALNKLKLGPIKQLKPKKSRHLFDCLQRKTKYFTNAKQLNNVSFKTRTNLKFPWSETVDGIVTPEQKVKLLL